MGDVPMSMHRSDISYFGGVVYRRLKYKPRTKGGAGLIFRLGVIIDDTPFINCYTRLPKPDWLRLFR